MSRRKRLKKIKQVASTDLAIVIVVVILFVGIILCYPHTEAGTKTLLGTGPMYIGQKILELIVAPVMIAQLLIIVTEDMTSGNKGD